MKKSFLSAACVMLALSAFSCNSKKADSNPDESLLEDSLSLYESPAAVETPVDGSSQESPSTDESDNK